jgi:hypothetical protein
MAIAMAITFVSSIAEDTTKPSQTEIDKNAFLRARKAASAETWTAALLVLKKIDVDKVEDVDVITYIDFSTRCAALAEELGVDRWSDPNSTKATLAEADFAKLFASMWDIIKKKGITNAARVVVEARRVQKQVPMYQKLDSQLVQKYGAE